MRKTRGIYDRIKHNLEGEKMKVKNPLPIKNIGTKAWKSKKK